MAPPRRQSAARQRRFCSTTYQLNVADSFEASVLAHFIENTNGRTSSLWAQVPHENPPQSGDMTWNQNALVYGMNGFTAISQLNSWTPWNSSSQSWAIGQPSVTAVSPRHAIMRGDGMGDPGAKNTVNGMQVWFVTADQQLITATVAGARQNTPGGYTVSDGTNCFTILIFSEDLPSSISPMLVGPVPLDTTVFFQTSQLSPGPNPGGVAALGGALGCGVAAPFNNFWYGLNGGDSGSPMMLPTPDNYLVLYGIYSGSLTPGVVQYYMNWLCDQQQPPVAHYTLQTYTNYPSQ